MHSYYVIFSLNGELKDKSVEACNPGQAFAKVLKEQPSAVLKKAVRMSQWFGEAFTEYDPPKVQRNPVPEPRPFRGKPTKADPFFSFYSEIPVRPKRLKE